MSAHGNSFFIPIFFILTGFLINPLVFFESIISNFPLASAIIALLVGKWIAAETVGRALRLYRSRTHDEVVIDLTTGGGNTRGDASRIRYSKSGWPTPNRCPLT